MSVLFCCPSVLGLDFPIQPSVVEETMQEGECFLSEMFGYSESLEINSELGGVRGCDI